MKQWHDCKKKAKDALLLFRLGDFYEAFYEDASILAKELNLALTKRQDVPMAGIPAHTCENYLDKLTKKGHIVALAEQIEDPKKVKGIVKRDVVRIVSPGTTFAENSLQQKNNNFFICITQVNTIYALAMLDLSTSELYCIEHTSLSELEDEIFKCAPSEILISKKCYEKNKSSIEDLKQRISFRVNIKEDWLFDHRTSYEFLTRHFGVHSLDGFGMKELHVAVNACGTLLRYIEEDLSLPIDHIKSAQVKEKKDYLSIDKNTLRNLQILTFGNSSNSLIHLLDKTCTPMGGRLLYNWVLHPLLDISKIKSRQDAIEELIEKKEFSQSIHTNLSTIRDIERLIARVSSGYATPKDIAQLLSSLEPIDPIKALLSKADSSLLQIIYNSLPNLDPIIELITNALAPNPPHLLRDGNIFKAGHSEELDKLYHIKNNAKQFLLDYQTTLKEQVGIKTLRVNFNRAFGYFIEVSRKDSEKLPDSFERRQTLVNAERYITPELKEFEAQILTADDQIQNLEKDLFERLILEVKTYLSSIIKAAKCIATLDVLLSLANVAIKYDYHRPTIKDSTEITILDGRHPIIESTLIDHSFVQNDTHLTNEASLFIITGPNMAGKSTYIRQVALLVLLAQMGSFIPASKATIGIVDKIFSRIGANDDLTRGQSTFMVEMAETAHILHHATHKSLVILDEIGRGTSTYDGISIAFAVAEHLLTAKKQPIKTLFATHYYELTELTRTFPKAKNYNVSIRETGEDIIFMHKIVEGSADKSYGIHVAKLAGLPESVLLRAKKHLKTLETIESQPKKRKRKDSDYLGNDLFADPKSSSDPILEEIKSLDLDQVTPLQALNKILSWKTKASK